MSVRSATASMPSDLSPRRIRRRLAEFAVVAGLVSLAIVLLPGLGDLRDKFAHASSGWVVGAVVLEVMSAVSYVVIFRAVFCPRMSWRLSYQIGMAEQGANSVLSVSGAGGLALGAWALNRGGMSLDHIARRTVAFFFLTSLANVTALIVSGLLYAVGILSGDPNPALTYGFVGAAAGATIVVLALPALLSHKAVGDAAAAGKSGRLARTLRFVRRSLTDGIRDAVSLLRQRSIGVLAGSFGTMAFDIAVLWASFRAIGHSPAIGVLALGYLIGQLGGNVPIPGGIGGIDGGLIGAFALYHQPLAATTAAVLIYHAIALWVPAILGSTAFVQLRETLRKQSQPAAMCMPLAEGAPAPLPAATASSVA